VVARVSTIQSPACRTINHYPQYGSFASAEECTPLSPAAEIEKRKKMEKGYNESKKT
jgi:hypothetical protein